MTFSAINSSSQTYVNKAFTGSLNATNKLENADDGIEAVIPSDIQPETKNNSLTQSVLQSLQNLGLDATGTLDEQASSNELQSFVQSLYTVLTPKNTPPSSSTPMLPASANGEESGIVESTVPTITTISGGTNLKYKIDLSGADLGDYLPQVAANIQTALENIGKYIRSNAIFDVKVLTRNSETTTLAEASTTMITATANGQETVDSSFISDSMYGVELSPNMPDSSLYINIDRLAEMSFSGKPSPDQFDLTSILTHEILHGVAFSGLLGSESELRTGYDELVTTINDKPYFTGRHARMENNGHPVPLSPRETGEGSAFYHVADPNDLMAAAIKKGEVKSISALDIAMLEDMGIAVTGQLPNSAPSKVQTAYNNAPLSPSDAVKNLMNSMQSQGELQTNFDNLVDSLGGADSSDVNLQNFLAQLALNTQQLPPIENTGSLFSVSA